MDLLLFTACVDTSPQFVALRREYRTQQKKLPISYLWLQLEQFIHWEQLIITAKRRWQSRSLVIFMYLHAFMHTWPAFTIMIASLWFDKSKKKNNKWTKQASVHFHITAQLMRLPQLLFIHASRWHSSLWFTWACFFVGMTATGAWLTSRTPRAEWAATAQMSTARSASRRRAPTKRISPSPPTCQPLAPSTHLCRVSVFYSGS